MTLRGIVQRAAGSLGQPDPGTVIGNSNGDAVLWLNLAQIEGEHLASRHDWQALIVQQTWTTTATVAQALALPADYDHLPPDPEVWDQTSNTRLVGPLSSRDWQILNSSGTTGGTAGWWRIVGAALNIYPAPTAGRTYALEYVSNYWCESSLGVGRSGWLNDADVAIIPERLMSLGVTWRWLRAKGMDYAEEMSTYEREVERAASRDRGSNIMVVGGSSEDDPPQPFWNGTITP